MTVQEKIHEYLSVHRDEMVEDIKTLIKVDSARAEALPGKPYGEGAAEALLAGLSLFEKHGFSGKNWDNYAIDTVINGSLDLIFWHILMLFQAETDGQRQLRLSL